MKRYLVVLALVLSAASASAQLRMNDVLLTDDGTLFAIESVTTAEYNDSTEAMLDTKSSAVLRLRTSRDEAMSEAIVPASLTGGKHIEPSLAFDTQDDRLYVFWQRIPNMASSELLFASYKDGVWSEATEFGGGGLWLVRMNLKAVITRFVTRTDGAGNSIRVPAMIAHAIWWEQNGRNESARYAMLELDRGAVTSVQLYTLNQILPPSDATPYVLPEDYDRNIFRTPFIFETPQSDSVDVVFANWDTNRYTIATVRPVDSENNGFIRIPIGVRGSETGPPILRNRTAEVYSVSAMKSGNGNVVIYANTGSAIDYSILRGGRWSPSKTLAINESMTLETGLEGLRRLTARN